MAVEYITSKLGMNENFIDSIVLFHMNFFFVSYRIPSSFSFLVSDKLLNFFKMIIPNRKSTKNVSAMRYGLSLLKDCPG